MTEINSEVAVSVIVPVYNTREYLEQCLASLRQQTLDAIEIIVIDDGSTDGSADIMETFRALDSRITVIHQANKGVSAARNAGLRVARGQYVGFVDSDDHVEPQMFEALWSAARRHDAEIVMCGVDRAPVPLPVNRVLAREDIRRQVLMGHRTRMIWYTWRNIYKRSLIDKGGICFPETIRIGEDSLFNLEAFLCATRAYAIDAPFYHYRANISSTTGRLGRAHSEILEANLIRQYEKKLAILDKYTDDAAFVDELHLYVCAHTMFLLLDNIISKRITPHTTRTDLRRVLDLVMIRRGLAVFKMRHFRLVTRRQFAFIACVKAGVVGLGWYLYRRRSPWGMGLSVCRRH